MSRDPQRPERDASPSGGLSAPPHPASAQQLVLKEPPKPFQRSQPLRASTSVAPVVADLSRTPVHAELMSSLLRLRQRFRDVAAVVEGLGALRSLGGEEALIELAMFAQSHEQTVEQAWKALSDCEQLARLVCSAPAVSSPPPSDPSGNLETEPAPVPAHALVEDDSAEEDGPVTQVDVAAPARVLVVDDDPTVLRAFRRVLQADHEIVTARDGAEALKVVLGDKRVDAIICDIGMPKLDGPTFFSELFELRPQLMPRVVFCTGGLPNEKTQRFLDRLQAPLLFKPVAAADLLRAIDFVRTR
jgi:CheY-like chemotaxis protein